LARPKSMCLKKRRRNCRESTRCCRHLAGRSGRGINTAAGVWTFFGRKLGRSPEGTADNSQAVHCREHVGTNRVPKGRLNSIPQNMIFDSTDFDSLHFVLAGDAAHERPQSLTQNWRDEFAPFFRAENQMNRIAHVRHAGIQPSLRDSINSNSSPAVNCRAIFVSPSGRSTGIGTPEFPDSRRGIYTAGTPALQIGDWKFQGSSLPNFPAD